MKLYTKPLMIFMLAVVSSASLLPSLSPTIDLENLRAEVQNIITQKTLTNELIAVNQNNIDTIHHDLALWEGRPESKMGGLMLRLGALALGTYVGSKIYGFLWNNFTQKPDAVKLTEWSNKLALEMSPKIEEYQSLKDALSKEKNEERRAQITQQIKGLEAYFNTINEELKKQNQILQEFQNSESSVIKNAARFMGLLGTMALSSFAVKELIAQILQKYPAYNPLTDKELARREELKRKEKELLKNSDLHQKTLHDLRLKKKELRTQMLKAQAQPKQDVPVVAPKENNSELYWIGHNFDGSL